MEKNKPKRKPGRPKSEEPKEHRFTLRMNDTRHYQLEGYSEYLKTSKTFILEMALDELGKQFKLPLKKPPVMMSEDDPDFYMIHGTDPWPEEMDAEDDDFDEFL